MFIPIFFWTSNSTPSTTKTFVDEKGRVIAITAKGNNPDFSGLPSGWKEKEEGPLNLFEVIFFVMMAFIVGGLMVMLGIMALDMASWLPCLPNNTASNGSCSILNTDDIVGLVFRWYTRAALAVFVLVVAGATAVGITRAHK